MSIKLYNALQKMKKVIDWQPNHIFYKSEIEWHDYDEPDYIFGCKIDGYSYSDKTFTRLGQWFEDAPDILQIIKLPYYIITWPIWFVITILWQLIGLFFPSEYDTCF